MSEGLTARSELRSRARLLQVTGRGLVIWMGAFVVLHSDGVDTAKTFAVTTAIAAIYLFVLQWVTRAARAMPLVFGSGSVAALGALGGLAVLSACAAWIDDLDVGVQDMLVITAVVFVGTWVWDVFVRREGTVPLGVLLIGGGERVSELIDDIQHRREGAGFRVVGVAADTIAPDLVTATFRVVPLSELEELIAGTTPDLVVVAVDDGRPAVFSRLLAVASTERFNVLGLPEFYEVAFGRLPIRALTPAWFMSTLHFYNRPYNRIAKRTFDIVAAIAGMIVAIPLFPIAAIIVKRTPGPLFYRQVRLGEYGRTFEIVKFRSMVVDAEQPGAAVFAEKNDPRIIPGGNVLRRLRLDEIPQLWNVLRGEMSMVGPRPERPEFLDVLAKEIPYWTQRNLLKPGVTGWAQVRAGYASDDLGAEEKLSYDLWYLRHRSLVVDILICLKTVGTMLTASGSR